MAIIAKNNTASNLDIYIKAGKRIQIAQGDQVDLLVEITKDDIAGADDLLFHLKNDEIIINNGTDDLSFTEAIDLIRDHHQVLPTDEGGLTTNLSTQKTLDGRLYIYSTSRPVGTVAYFTSVGDDPTNHRSIGGGEELEIKHKIGEPYDQVMYIDFNTIINKTYVHEGYLLYRNCDCVLVSVHFVPSVTSFVPSTNTFYNFNQGLIVPAAGDGTIDLTEAPKFVEAGNDDLGMPNIGFWNADYNETTGVFENITAAPLGDGAYNIFGAEVVLYRMIEQMCLLGDGKLHLQTQEHGSVNHGIRLKLISHLEEDETDRDFRVCGILSLFRDKVGQMA